MRKYPEVQLVATQLGRPDDGTDPTSFYNAEFFVPLKRQPVARGRDARRGGGRPDEARVDRGHERRRAEPRPDRGQLELLSGDPEHRFEVLSGVQGENSVKIIGPDLDELERLAQQVSNALASIPGHPGPGAQPDHGPGEPRVCYRPGQMHPVERPGCRRRARHPDGRRRGPLHADDRRREVLRRDPAWPERLRESEWAILEIPVDVIGHQVTEGAVAQLAGTPFSGPSTGISTIGTSHPMPTLTGSRVSGALINLSTTPQRRLRELVIPVGPDGQRDPSGRFVRPGAVMIYRDQGSRMIAVKFGVRGRDLRGPVHGRGPGEGRRTLIKAPYRVEWSGEIRQMEQAERRLVIIIGVSLGLIFSLLYLALGSFLDVLVIGTSVAMMSLGGIWALVLTHTNFNISAAVGFISIFGVTVMDGLLLVSYFNQLRRQGLPLKEAIHKSKARPADHDDGADGGLQPLPPPLERGSARKPRKRWPSSWLAECSRRCF